MMVWISLYSIVDGIFISNFVGKTAFSAINLIYPVVMVIASIGFMMGTGGSALVAKIRGEGDEKRAKQVFSSVVYFTCILGIVFSIVIIFFVEDIARILGANEEMVPYCKVYGQILIGAEVFFMLQNLFQSMFITAERPMIGFAISLLSGVVNIIFDAVFVIGLNLGVKGAAIATIMGQFFGAMISIIYFIGSKNGKVLNFVKTKLELRVLTKTSFNGVSELLSNISGSIVSMVYNKQLMILLGENGVAAYGILMYTTFVFMAIFIGYSIGIGPAISYHYGAQNKEELKNLLKKSIIINFIIGIVMTTLALVLA